MPEKIEPKKIASYFNEEKWIRQFVDVYGTDGVTTFSENNLRGVSLVRVIQALALGAVVTADKPTLPDMDCTVEYTEEDGIVVRVSLSIQTTPPRLIINFVEQRRENENGNDHAA